MNDTTTNQRPADTGPFLPDGDYPATVVAAESVTAADGTPAWNVTFTIRDHITSRTFAVPIELPLDAGHMAYTAGIAGVVNPAALDGPVPRDPATLRLVGRIVALVIRDDVPIGIRALEAPDAAS